MLWPLLMKMNSNFNTHRCNMYILHHNLFFVVFLFFISHQNLNMRRKGCLVYVLFGTSWISSALTDIWDHHGRFSPN